MELASDVQEVDRLWSQLVWLWLVATIAIFDWRYFIDVKTFIFSEKWQDVPQNKQMPYHMFYRKRFYRRRDRVRAGYLEFFLILMIIFAFGMEIIVGNS